MAFRPYTRTEPVQTTLTRAQREELDRRAAGLGRSRADTIRELILDGMRHDDPR